MCDFHPELRRYHYVQAENINTTRRRRQRDTRLRRVFLLMN